MKRFLASLSAALVLVACSGGGPNPNPVPTGRRLSVPELKLRVLAAIGGRLDYCDPDVYPIAHGTRLGNAIQHLQEMRTHRAIFDAILQHEGVSPAEAVRGAGLLRVYTDYKEIGAIPLSRSGDRYEFTVYESGTGGGPDHLVTGTISASGDVSIQSRLRSGRPNCPICLARGALIATPTGPVPVTSVRVGMTVWSTGRDGRLIRSVVLETRRRRATGDLLRIALADGRTVLVSPGHPTASGRLVGDLLVGDPLAGSSVSAITLVPYDGFTYDLLTSGPTGTYFADGVLLGSTLQSAA